MTKYEDKKRAIRISDYVSFHTRHGATTGIVEYIAYAGGDPLYDQAIITVRDTFSGRPRRYRRRLFKLKFLDFSQGAT